MGTQKNHLNENSFEHPKQMLKVMGKKCKLNLKKVYSFTLKIIFYLDLYVVVFQVQWNLFTVHTLNQAPEERVPVSKHSIWFPCQEVEDNFRKFLTPQELTEGLNNVLIIQ